MTNTSGKAGGYKVAPFAGAWIEMLMGLNVGLNKAVAPFAGAWIEIAVRPNSAYRRVVAPFAGAWIEILLLRCSVISQQRRSLRGSVD